MAPFFGASTIVWANTIAVVLVALSIGYRLGGRLADRRPSARALCRARAAGRVLLAVVPLVAAPVPVAQRAGVRHALGRRVRRLAVRRARAGRRAGAAARRGLAVGDPAEAGATSPTAGEVGRAPVRDLDRRLAGRDVARVARADPARRHAAHVPVLALVPAAVAALAAARALAGRAGGAGAALALPVGTVKPAETGRVLYETETEYQYARVVQYPDGSRRLELNEGQAIHSLWRPGTVLTGNYWDGFLVCRSPRRRRRRRSAIAILGTAGGTIARAYAALLSRARRSTRSRSTAQLFTARPPLLRAARRARS